MNSVKLSDFLFKHNDSREARALWELMKASAEYVVRVPNDELLFGEDLDLSEDKICEMTDGYAVAAEKIKKPYGNVHYCDVNLRGDGKSRFPCDTKEHTKAAWSYAHHKSIMSKYSSEQLSRLHSCIASAYKKFFGEEPPSAQEK